MRRHLVGSLGNRSCARFQVYDEFNSSSRGYSWKFFWKDIFKITNDWNVLDSLKRWSIQCIENIYLTLSILDHLSWVVDQLARRVCELDFLSGTVDQSIMGCQPIHTNNDVYVGRSEYNERTRKSRPPISIGCEGITLWFATWIPEIELLEEWANFPYLTHAT